MAKLCSEGHVIGEGREVCDRDGLPASQDEFGTKLINPADTIMSDEHTQEESPKESEDSSVDSSESSEAGAGEAQAEVAAEETASAEAEATEGEKTEEAA